PAPQADAPTTPPPPTPPSEAASSAPSPQAKAPDSGPEVFGSLSARAAEGDKGKRTPLYIAIGLAALLLAGFAVWKALRPQTQAPVPASTTPLRAAMVTTPLPEAAPVPTAAAAALDPKAVEAEVQRQLAAKRKELEKAAAPSKKLPGAPDAPAATSPEPSAPEPTNAPPAEPAIVVPPRPEPTAIPTEPPPPEPVRIPVAPERETQRGDLVGPGPGVVEPVLISAPRIVYPPLLRDHRITGKVIVLVQIDENGKVIESRLQQGLAGQAAINEAVLAAVRNAKFQSATKNGIPVRMWRPVVVDVKP
ncbi:MAG: TonB family protein, partial [Acidobacteriota bacterium]